MKSSLNRMPVTRSKQLLHLNPNAGYFQEYTAWKSIYSPQHDKIPFSISNLHNNHIQCDDLDSTLQFLKQISGLEIKILNFDREKYKNDLKAAKKEIEDMKINFDFQKIQSKNSQREGDLRSCINHLGHSIYTRDIEKSAQSTNELYLQILENIHDITQKIVIQLTEKRKDIESRIHIRLVDSDYRQRKMLEEKVKEQEGILRSLHSFTQDMIRIKENYEIIRNKILKVHVENIKLAQKIDEERNKNIHLHQIFKNWKIQMKDLVQNMKRNAITNLSTSASISNTKLLAIHTSETQQKEIFNTEGNGIMKTDSTRLSTNRPSKAVFYLTNTLEGFNAKRKKMERDVKYKVPNNNIYLTVCRIIEYLKLAIVEKKKYEALLKNRVAKIAINVNNEKEIHHSSEYRRRFIDILVKDPEVVKILNDKQYPTINNFQRKVCSS